MTSTDHFMRRMSRVILPAGEHDVIPLDSLEALAHGACLSIEYPAPGAPGWATTRVGSQQFAAWLPVGVEA